MTGQEAIDSFLQYYDKITKFSGPGYEDSEILLFLNNAQDEFIKERVFGKNFQPPAFDDNQKRVADIRPLIKIGAWAGVTYSTIYGKSYNIDPYTNDTRFQYAFPRGLFARITRTNPSVTAEYVNCKRISIADAGKFNTNTLNRTWFKYPVYFVSDDGKIYILVDYYTTNLNAIRIEYTRKPYPITETINDFNGDYSASYMNLETHTHQEIVDIAVRQAVQVSGDERYQTQLVEEQIKSE